MIARLVFMLVIVATIATSREVAVAQANAPALPTPVRVSWMNRLSVGLSRSITRQALLQRLTFEVPQVAPVDSDMIDGSAAPPLCRRFRFCLPPPCA